MKWIGVMSVGTLAALFGCVSDAQVTAESIETAKAHCASEGKQFVLASTEKKPGTFFESKRILISGYCVAAGDPGYVASPAGTPDKKSSQR